MEVTRLRAGMTGLLMLILLAVTESAPDSQGKHFLVAFGANYPSNEKLVLFVSSRSQSQVEVNVSYYENGTTLNDVVFQQITLQPNTVEQVEISEFLRLDNSGGVQIENKTIIVTSSHEVSLYGVNRAFYSGEAFLVLPTDIWGMTYFVFSTNDVPADPDLNRVINGSQFSVIAKENTQVNITYSVKSSNLSVEYEGAVYSQNDVMTVNLKALETIHIAANEELTGVRVDSDSPVGVLSGHRRTGIVLDDGSDHLEEMIPPINTWGDDFIIPPIAWRSSYDIIKIVAATDGNTTVNVTGQTDHLIRLEYAGDYATIQLTSDTYFVVQSDGPVGVMQYCISNAVDYAGTDPFMIWITPIAQYNSKYSLATAEGVSEAYYQNLAVVYKLVDFAGLTINGVNLSNSDGCADFSIPHCENLQLNVTEAFEGEYGFTIYDMNDDTSSYIIEHAIDPTVAIGVYVYGQVDLEAYGYPGGSRFANLGRFCQSSTTVSDDGVDNDCDSRVDEELWNGLDDDGDGLIDEDLVGEILFTATTETTEATTASTNQALSSTNQASASTHQVSSSINQASSTTNQASASTSQVSASTTSTQRAAVFTSTSSTAGSSRTALSTTISGVQPSSHGTGTSETTVTDGMSSGGKTTSEGDTAATGSSTSSHSSVDSTAAATTIDANRERQQNDGPNVPVIVGATVPTLLIAAAAVGTCLYFVLAARKKKRKVEDEEEANANEADSQSGDKCDTADHSGEAADGDKTTTQANGNSEQIDLKVEENMEGGNSQGYATVAEGDTAVGEGFTSVGEGEGITQPD